MDKEKMLKQYLAIRKQILDLSKYHMYKPNVEPRKRRAGSPPLPQEEKCQIKKHTSSLCQLADDHGEYKSNS